MYFGSVRFFKHVIMAVIALLIIIPVIFSIVLSGDNSQKSQELSRLADENARLTALADYYSGETALTADDILKLLENTDISTTELVNKLYERDSDAFKQVAAALSAEQTFADITTADNSISAQATTPTSSAETSAPESEAAEITVLTTAAGNGETSEYSDLYPELYAVGTQNLVYNQDMNYVYLTFDDGPSQYTPSILYYLKQYNLKATFFVVPDESEETCKLMKQIVDEGHTIAVHTASHVYKDIYASVEAYLEDFSKAYTMIYNATGVKCKLFRFPGGSKNDYNNDTRDAIIAEMTRRGFIYFDWNVDSGDAAGATWTEMYNSVIKDTAETNRAVILLHDHDNGYNTVLVLEDIIKALLNDERNYIIDKLTENVKPVQF